MSVEYLVQLSRLRPKVIIPEVFLHETASTRLSSVDDMAYDPLSAAELFSVAGEITVGTVDLEQIVNCETNILKQLVARFACRLSGIHDVETAIRWLDIGASKVILDAVVRTDA